MSLFKHSEINWAERLSAFYTGLAFSSARNAHLVSREYRELLEAPADTRSAVSRDARIGWYRALCDELEQRFDYQVTDRIVDREFYLVTLVHADFAVGHEDVGIDLKPIRQHYRTALHGFDYLGVIEPGPYSYINVVDSNGDRQKCVSWHVHALVWNTSRKDIRKRVRDLNRSGQCIALTPSQTGADQRRIRDFDYVVGYVCKPPTHAYRIGLVARDRNGRCAPKPRQYSSDLRPGERVTMFRHLMHHRVDRLMIAGGEGKDVLGATRARFDAR